MNHIWNNPVFWLALTNGICLGLWTSSKREVRKLERRFCDIVESLVKQQKINDIVKGQIQELKSMNALETTDK